MDSRQWYSRGVGHHGPGPANLIHSNPYVAFVTALINVLNVPALEESSLSVGAKISATVGIPEVASASAEASTEVTFTNSQDSS